MDKWKGRYLMTVGVFLQACAAIGFAVVGDSDGMSIIFAIPLAVVSLGIFGRGSVLASQEKDATPAPATPPAPQPRLEEMIIALQEDVNRLREDREFYRELYADGGATSLDVVERPARNRDLTYRLVPERSSEPRPPSSGR